LVSTLFGSPVSEITQMEKKNYNFFFFFFPELGTEPRALRLLGKRSTTELNPQPQGYFLRDGFLEVNLSIGCEFIVWKYCGLRI